VNIPVGLLERPFSTIAESINRTIFAIRERTPLFQGTQKRKEIGGVIGGAAPVTGEAKAARPPSDEVNRPAAKPPSAEVAPAPKPEPIRSAPISAEIQVEEPVEAEEYNPEATVVAMVPTEFMEQVDKEMNAMRQAKEASRGGDPLAAVYAEFLQARLRCGEKVENLSQERFIEKLKKNREQIIAQTNCRDVRFNVVVKDGKASIKASPIR